MAYLRLRYSGNATIDRTVTISISDGYELASRVRNK